MTDLKTTTALVKWLLEIEPKTRNSDSFLYLKVLEHIALENGIKLDFMTVRQFFGSLGVLPFPGFETVRRTRQKLQQSCPELAADQSVEHNRMEREKLFRDYARHGG